MTRKTLHSLCQKQKCEALTEKNHIKEKSIKSWLPIRLVLQCNKRCHTNLFMVKARYTLFSHHKLLYFHPHNKYLFHNSSKSQKKQKKIYICIIKMRNSHFCQCQFYNSFNLHNQFLWHSTRTSNLSLLSHEVFSTFPYTFLKFGSYVAHNINTVKSYLHVYID